MSDSKDPKKSGLSPTTDPELFRTQAEELLEKTINRIVLSSDEKQFLRAVKTWLRQAPVGELRNMTTYL